MKKLNQFIIEKLNSFILTDNERDSLIELVGYATEQLGKDSDIKAYEEFRKECTQSELNSLNSLYDLLDNKNYPKITNRLINLDEIDPLIKLINYAVDNDLVDLSNILDKIVS